MQCKFVALAAMVAAYLSPQQVGAFIYDVNKENTSWVGRIEYSIPGRSL